MKIITKFSQLALLVFLITTGCSNSEQDYYGIPYSEETATMAKLKVLLVDAPAKIEKLEKVLVTIDKIQIGSDDNWLTVVDESKEYDLLELAGSLNATIAAKNIPAGEYKQLRLIIGENNRLVIDGKESHLEIPGGMQTGIKLTSPQGAFSLKPGKIFEITVDFDAQQSLHAAGSANKYILKPVIKIIAIHELDTEPENIANHLLPEDSSEKVGVFWDGVTRNPNLVMGSFAMGNRASPEIAVEEFLSKYKGLFRLNNPARELVMARSNFDEQAMSHFRFKQNHKGVKIFGGALLFHLNHDNVITSINGRVLTGIVIDDVEPALSEAEAVNKVLESGISGGLVSDPELTIFNERFITNQGDRSSYLTYKLRIRDEGADGLHEWVCFVDASSGRIVFKYDDIQPIRDRKTYSAGNSWTLPGTLWLDESGALPGYNPDSDAWRAHNFAGDFYDYLFNNFGRDGYDGVGGTIKSSVHVGPSGWRNAYWNGAQVAYGDGFSTRDIVAHELTHGLIDHTADLIYAYESGAMNESFADFFGAMLDDDDWLMGEDSPLGAIRSLANPTHYDQPDHMCNIFYLPIYIDNGGVHHNSGILNKAAYQIATRTSNERAAQYYYRALTQYLFPSARFEDARNALILSARDLNTSPYDGRDVYEVFKAFQSVGLGRYNYEGVTGFLNKQQITDSAPLYHWYNPDSGNDMYIRTSGDQLASQGYFFRGKVGYINTTPETLNLRTLYRWFNPYSGDHFYTTHPDGRSLSVPNYKYEGITGHIHAKNVEGTTALYRWFSPISGDHFYTTHPTGENAPAAGYVSEGITGYINTSNVEGTTALYRWFSPISGDHMYTTNPTGEKAPAAGYVYEGITGYVHTERRVPLRVWSNPTHTSHFYTTSPRGEGAEAKGYEYRGIIGYIELSRVASSKPFYRWWSPLTSDYFYDTEYAPSGCN